MMEPSLPDRDAPCPHCGSLLWFPRAILGDESLLPACDVVLLVQAATPEAAIREMLRGLVRRKHLASPFVEEIAEEILRREELGSTGIGRGFAVPHISHWSVRRLVVAMATSEQGVPYNSLDGQPVHTFFLLISPEDRPGDQLRAIEKISRFLKTQSS